MVGRIQIDHAARIMVQQRFDLFEERLGEFALDDIRDAAACCGLTPWQRLVHIEIPLAWPGILTAAILAFAHTLGEFGVVLMVGGNVPGETRTLSVAIYDRMQAFDDRSAGVMAATLLVVSVVTLMTTTVLSRRVVARRG